MPAHQSVPRLFRTEIVERFRSGQRKIAADPFSAYSEIGNVTKLPGIPLMRGGCPMRLNTKSRPQPIELPQKPSGSTDPFLTDFDLERLTKRARSSWQKARLTGNGPPFVRLVALCAIAPQMLRHGSPHILVFGPLQIQQAGWHDMRRNDIESK
jgi:hypothetical protein